MGPSSVALLVCAVAVGAATQWKSHVKPVHWPFTVAIMSEGQIVGNGVILNQYWVLTTAHCLLGIDPNTTKVLAGLSENGQQIREYRRHTIFPDYPRNPYVDFGLLRIQGSFEFCDDILPGQMAAEPFPRLVSCDTIGWSKTFSHMEDFLLVKYRLNPIKRRGCLRTKRSNYKYLICTESTTLNEDGKCDSESSRLLVCRGIIAGILVGRFTDKANTPLNCSDAASPTYEVNLHVGAYHWFIQNYVYDLIPPTPLYDAGCGLRVNCGLLALALMLTV